MNLRAQISMEYLAVFAFVIMITIPLLLIYSIQTRNMQNEVLNAQLYDVISTIGDSAEEIYFEGPPAKKTLRIYFPKGIKSININQSYIEASYVSGETQIFITKDTSANMTGTIRTFPGEHMITFTANTSDVFVEDK